MSRLLPALLLIAALLPASASATDSRVLNALLDGVLEAHVDDGYVDYPAIARNVRFHKYLEAIAEFDADSLADDKERMAFWINAYNALVIKEITNGQTPIGAIAKIKFFRTTEHRVGGRNIDLQSIADDILFEFDDPRVHFAIVDSAYSAPRLRSEAYRVDELDQQLEDNVRNFLNDNRKNRISETLRRAKLSPIFEDYADAFGGAPGGVLEFVSHYVDDDQLAEELAAGRFDLEYMDYDWSINGRPM
ncbi:MAG: DUF547 domain-containing protein [Gammaproteobacteria bacterium]|nr:DUF547 domain-containing protein [Gammaproteobacteria bacterium]MCP5202089.1 DUF547 domain-containing protein [Gammaproteobacteria bacterium]